MTVPQAIINSTYNSALHPGAAVLHALARLGPPHQDAASGSRVDEDRMTADITMQQTELVSLVVAYRHLSQ